MQPDLFTATAAEPTDAEKLRAHLDWYKTWRTREEIERSLGWSERHIRRAAESLGTEILRSQAGFKLRCHYNRDTDMILVQACADSFISQGKKMIRYGVGIKQFLHRQVG